MTYIPIEHRKYDILPICRENGGEVFSYSSELESKIGKLLPYHESVIPYGYDSYEEFDKKVNGYIFQYGIDNGKTNQLGQLLTKYKTDIRYRNVKENWSIMKYIGELEGDEYDLTRGRCYYWPCSIEEPRYEGVIDDEEFTSYLYPTDCQLWEIVEDPTGMARHAVFDGKFL